MISPMVDVEFQYNCLLCGFLRTVSHITEGEMDYNPLDRDVHARFYCKQYEMYVDEVAVERYNKTSNIPVLGAMKYKNNYKHAGDKWEFLGIEPYQSPYVELPLHYRVVSHALKDTAKECVVFLSNITRCNKKCGDCAAYKRSKRKCESPAAMARRKLLEGVK